MIATPGRRLVLGPVLSVLIASQAAPQVDCDLAWRVVASPSASDELNALSGLGPVAEDDIWACGSSSAGDRRHTMTQHWDGKKWSVVPSPDGPRRISWLTGIAAVSTDNVWTSGYSMDSIVGRSQSETLLEQWDGKVWNVVPSPNLTEADVSEEFGGFPVSNELFGIAAVSKDDIWSVGHSFTFSQGQELIIHWDGQEWRVVPSPHPGEHAWLRGVVAVSSKDVWAFGEYYAEVPLGGDEGGVGSLQQNLIEHWDGSNWNVVPSPNVGFSVNGLFGGSVVSPTDIWAVGYHLEVFGVNQPNQPSILRWDGANWNIVKAATVNRETAFLYSIVALSADEAIAVGFYDTGPPQPTYHTLVERWKGSEWVIEPSANPGDRNYLYAATAIFVDDLLAVGEQTSGEIIDIPLVERFSAACPDASLLRGDSNGDGRVDLSDAVATLGHLFLGDNAPGCFDAADADDSGTVEITDPIFLLGSLFLGQTPIPAPFPECGQDPTTDDSLGCERGCA